MVWRETTHNGHRLPSILEALHWTCLCLKGLKVLVIRKLPIHASHMPLLAGIFESVSGSLEELCIACFGFWEHFRVIKQPRLKVPQSYDSKSTEMSFGAVAKLEVLNMPDVSDYIVAGTKE